MAKNDRVPTFFYVKVFRWTGLICKYVRKNDLRLTIYEAPDNYEDDFGNALHLHESSYSFPLIKVYRFKAFLYPAVSNLHLLS